MPLPVSMIGWLGGGCQVGFSRNIAAVTLGLRSVVPSDSRRVVDERKAIRRQRIGLRHSVALALCRSGNDTQGNVRKPRVKCTYLTRALPDRFQRSNAGENLYVAPFLLSTVSWHI